jgi:hypothetical protein
MRKGVGAASRAAIYVALPNRLWTAIRRSFRINEPHRGAYDANGDQNKRKSSVRLPRSSSFLSPCPQIATPLSGHAMRNVAMWCTSCIVQVV